MQNIKKQRFQSYIILFVGIVAVFSLFSLLLHSCHVQEENRLINDAKKRHALHQELIARDLHKLLGTTADYHDVIKKYQFMFTDDHLTIEKRDNFLEVFDYIDYFDWNVMTKEEKSEILYMYLIAFYKASWNEKTLPQPDSFLYQIEHKEIDSQINCLIDRINEEMNRRDSKSYGTSVYDYISEEFGPSGKYLLFKNACEEH
ncbi:hypothetical protein PASE110613_15000 [Paenibacillus sediminis]|uniref:Lipoprotein n=1 Tax=Paenibacillus sediminis TaxID=664909 RepID=A0ABS4H617_9BACL|nr:hypothetical protein [Paenibacillus sediminis]MBP1937978.1 hypothetical protein [Paenibacillus sediminis]